MVEVSLHLFPFYSASGGLARQEDWPWWCRTAIGMRVGVAGGADQTSGVRVSG